MPREIGFENDPDVLARIRAALVEMFDTPSKLRAFVAEHFTETVGDREVGEEAFDLLGRLKASGAIPHLLRRGRRRSDGNPLAIISEQVLRRVTTPEEYESLVAILAPHPDLWSTVLAAVDTLQPPLDDLVYYRARWAKSVITVAIEAHCRDLIDVLAESAERADLPLKFPLFEFVRRVIRRPGASGLVGLPLRTWLRQASRARTLPYVDLTLVCRPAAQDLATAVAAEIAKSDLSTKVEALASPEGLKRVMDDAADRPGCTALCLSGPADAWAPAATDPASKALPLPSALTLYLFPLLLPGQTRSGAEATAAAFEPNALVSFRTPDDATGMLATMMAVTGEAPTAAQPRQKVPLAKRVAASLANEGLVVFLGPAASAPPSGYQLASRLLGELSGATSGGGDAATAGPVPPAAPGPLTRAKGAAVTPLDVAADYYSLRHDPDAMREFLSNVFRDGSASNVGVLKALVDVIKTTSGRLATRKADGKARTRVDRRPLIITTNLDLSLERMLLSENVSFTRVVQRAKAARRSGTVDGAGRAAETWVAVNDYVISDFKADKKRLTVSGRTHSFSSISGLDAAIETAGEVTLFDEIRPWAAIEEGKKEPAGEEDDVRPVLYKFHGSCDVLDSVLVSGDDFDTFDISHVPRDLVSRVRSSPVLFLGFSWIDPEFRHLRRTLLHGCSTPGDRQEAKRFAVHLPLPDDDPCRWIEDTLSPNIKRTWEAPPLAVEFHDAKWDIVLKDIVKALEAVA